MTTTYSNTLTITGLDQKDKDGTLYMPKCVILKGNFNPVSLHNMVTTIQEALPKISKTDLDIVGMSRCHAIKHRDWYVNLYENTIFIEQTGCTNIGFNHISYTDINSMELDFYTDGSTLVGIWFNLASGLQIRLF